MPKITYVEKKFSPATYDTIVTAEGIINELEAQGYDLTLRQLYYQFVAKGHIKDNTMASYKRLGSIINDARMAGLIDWDAIVDRTRNLQSNPHWDHPKDIVDSCVRQFQIEKWANQPERVEVWVEKEALIGVVAVAANRVDVPFFACRGYVSQSEMWRAGQRLISYGVPTTILHLGDHDPSGIDMTRDIEDRLRTFTERDLLEAYPEVERLALNMDQVREHNPPPNPAKITDSRATKYIREFGEESWELDALEPRLLDALITSAVLRHRDPTLWAEAVKQEEKHKRALEKVAKTLAPKKGKK